jgi:uncharacterized protein (TIGR03118 family)
VSGASADSRHAPRHTAFYLRTNLVSDIAGVALNTDPNLVNPWGIAVNPHGPIWVADNGTGLSSVFDNGGNPLPSEASPLVVTIAPPAGSPPDATAAPTGVVFNASSSFAITAGANSAPARFIFATEDGTVSGWNPTVAATSSVLGFDNSNAPAGAVYKGLALGHNATGDHIYLTNFHTGMVDVLDAAFHPVVLPGGFTDPNIPVGFAPFGIQNVGGMLYITYAKQNAEQHDDVSGPGNGYIDVFDTDGHLLRRFASQGALNSPWGMAVAPHSFGRLGGALLVGNFGDGRINAYNLATGAWVGALMDSRNRPIAIDGLWGLAFGVPESDRDDDNPAPLIFTAGIAHEAHGLFGKIEAARK